MLGKIITGIFKNQLDYYKSIDDLPIYNWLKIQETNDISWMLKTNHSLNEVHKGILTVAFDNIYSQFIDAFGINPALEEILTIKRDIAVLTVDMMLEKDRSLINFIEIKERELKALIASKNQGSVMEVTAYVEKYMQFKINTKEVTVREFYGYINLMKKEKRPKQ